MKENKKLGEVACVNNFLSNSHIIFAKKEVIPSAEQNDIKDVFFRDKKFQIVFADFEFQRAIGTATPDNFGVKMVEFTNTQQSTWRKFIIEPIKKKNKYGKSANGIILLINSRTEPPWIEKDLRIAKKIGLKNELILFGFDEIFLVCPTKNIAIYP